MGYGLSRGNKHEMGRFKKKYMLVNSDFRVGFNLICIFELTCHVKKLHGSARPEIVFYLQFSVWALQ